MKRGRGLLALFFFILMSIEFSYDSSWCPWFLLVSPMRTTSIKVIESEFFRYHIIHISVYFFSIRQCSTCQEDITSSSQMTPNRLGQVTLCCQETVPETTWTTSTVIQTAMLVSDIFRFQIFNFNYYWPSSWCLDLLDILIIIIIFDLNRNSKVWAMSAQTVLMPLPPATASSTINIPENAIMAAVQLSCSGLQVNISWV